MVNAHTKRVNSFSTWMATWVTLFKVASCKKRVRRPLVTKFDTISGNYCNNNYDNYHRVSAYAIDARGDRFTRSRHFFPALPQTLTASHPHSFFFCCLPYIPPNRFLHTTAATSRTHHPQPLTFALARATATRTARATTAHKALRAPGRVLAAQLPSIFHLPPRLGAERKTRLAGGRGPRQSRRGLRAWWS